MKAKFLKMMMLISIVLFMGSCSDETTSNDGNNFQSASREAETLENILARMKAMAVEERKIITFDLGLEDGIYNVSNIRFLEGFEEEFAFAYSSAGGVQVDCTVGETTTSTNCPDGPGQGSCVGTAVRNCLDSGGCATVCRAQIAMAP